MALQEKIAAELNEEMKGKVLKVIIDRKEGDYYVGRTEYDSPEVDQEVLIPVNGKKLRIGFFYQVKIEKSDGFDLFGSII